MATSPPGRGDGDSAVTDGAPANRLQGAGFPELRLSAVVLPPLHTPAAQTLVRDRREQLVTAIDIPSPRPVVWQALTSPAALRSWLAACHGSLAEPGRDCVLDFEDGEFFLCRPILVRAPERLQYLWRWLGIGQATRVTWALEEAELGTRVTVTEEAENPPWDWQTWNGGGWPGILDQLAAHLRTGMDWRWPWRRMGPYAQVELAAPFYVAWDALLNAGALRYWLQVMAGDLAPGQTLTLLMGDASGVVEMKVGEVIPPGQRPPSFLPLLDFSLRRPVWGSQVGGKLWLEPAGWGRSLLQIFLFNWENLPAGLQLSERKILTNFLAGAARRATTLLAGPAPPIGPHGWS
jgi:uncharacterized protein YndB with AHSA1/START domain